MVSMQENWERWKAEIRFSKQELSGLIPAILILAFIFSFRDWGTDTFDAILGLQHFVQMISIVAIVLFFRITFQKMYALSQGYKAEFKVWWAGLAISLVVAFISFGKVPLVLAGLMTGSFAVRYRLGEFRYGYNIWQNGVIGYWAIMGGLIMAILFSVGYYWSPESYFFSKGLMFSLIAAFCSLIPIPQLDAINIIMGSRTLYVVSITLSLAGAVLLLTRTKPGLIIALVFALGYGAFQIIIGSER